MDEPQKRSVGTVIDAGLYAEFKAVASRAGLKMQDAFADAIRCWVGKTGSDNPLDRLPRPEHELANSLIDMLASRDPEARDALSLQVRLWRRLKSQ